MEVKYPEITLGGVLMFKILLLLSFQIATSFPKKLSYFLNQIFFYIEFDCHLFSSLTTAIRVCYHILKLTFLRQCLRVKKTNFGPKPPTIECA